MTIEIHDGIIANIYPNDPINLKDAFYIAPGFIDNQVNGYVSVDFSEPNLTIEQVAKVTKELWKTGVTTYLPTLITSSKQTLVENVATLAEAVKDPQIGCSVPGFHLEGPYISPVDGFRGAHNKEWIRNPDWQEFVQIYEAADRRILQVTIAPELPGAMNFIQKCIRNGIIVALGHHNASSEKIKLAVDYGAKIVTHLGNGCANFIHRHNNPIWPQLADDRLMISIIVDGFHLLPEEVMVFYKTKGQDKIILTSDCTSLAGMPPGKYTWNGKTVAVSSEGVIHYPAQNVLAGAALPLSVGVGNMIQYSSCTLADAIHMTTRNPAKLYQLEDLGKIEIGKRADLILFTWRENKIILKKTFVAGRQVFG